MKFSPTAFISVFLVHAGGNILLFLAAFGTAMSAFNRPSAEVQLNMNALTVFGWFWSTGPSVLHHFFGVLPTIPVHFCWSVIVAIISACIIPQLRRRRDGPESGKD